jgi:putative hydrolase of HD superfamily
VADHSFGLALIALYEGERRGYDMEEILKLSLIHDLEEAITGDLAPRSKSRLGAKRVDQVRRKARNEILARFPAKSRSSYGRLWMDLKEGRTREARLVHQLDKLEMAFQAHQYQRYLSTKVLEDFYRSAHKAVTDPVLREELAGLTGKGSS